MPLCDRTLACGRKTGQAISIALVKPSLTRRYLLKVISEAGIVVWLYLEQKQYLLDTHTTGCCWSSPGSPTNWSGRRRSSAPSTPCW
jgi:hypothetical protein